jgi:hypothetical protein
MILEANAKITCKFDKFSRNANSISILPICLLDVRTEVVIIVINLTSLLLMQ